MMNSLIREADNSSTTFIPPPEFGMDPNGPVTEEEIGMLEIPLIISPLNEEDLQTFTVFRYRNIL